MDASRAVKVNGATRLDCDAPAVAGPAASSEAADTVVQWPMAKMIENMRQAGLLGPAGGGAAASPPSAAPSRTAVLVSTGGMNPMHRGHVAMLYQARARLEQEGYTVLGAWLSPSHDEYLQPKAMCLRTIGLSAPFRVELAGAR